jgi:ABC-type branched-subunit amino acid transport system substrate-binding protein
MEQFRALGSVAVPIDFHATYQALVDGAVSGQENPLVAIVGMRFHEVQKYLTLSSHAWLGYVFSASQSVFAQLPQSLRELIVNTARELTVWEREETARREAGFLEKIRQAGVEVIELTAEERQRFQTLLAPLARTFAMTIGYDLLAKTEELRLRQALPQMQPAPLVIGLDADLSNGSFLAGAAILRGAELAVEQINASGGLLGRPVRWVAMDHIGNQAKGLENLRTLAEWPGLIGVVGGLHSVVIMHEVEIIHQRQIPYLVPWAAAAKVVDNGRQPNYVFRLSLQDADVAPFLLREALRAAAGKKVAVLLERTDWGRSNEAAISSIIAEVGGGRVIIEWVNRGDQAFVARLQALKQQGVGAVMMATNFVESVHIVNAMAQLNPPLPILSHWGLTGGDFWNATEKALRIVDLRFVQSFVLPTDHPALAELIARYRAYYGLQPEQPIPAVSGTLHSYELVQLLAQAIRQAGVSDRAAIRDALEHLDHYPGVLRDYAPPFSPDQHEIIGGLPFHLARFNPQGRIVLAE